ncbi:MAG: glycosyltransferase family 1 protein [Verrucomicrobiota bacterium]
MRIGYSATIWDDAGSGIGLYIAEQLKQLRKTEGIDLKVLEFGGRVLESDQTPAFGSSGRGVRRIVAPAKDIIWHRNGLKEMVAREAFDLVHVPTIRRLPGSLPCPSVVTVHDLGPVRLAQKYGRLRDVYHRKVIPGWLDDVTAIVTPSEATLEDLVEIYDCDRKKITVVPNGLDHDAFSPGDPVESRDRMVSEFGLEAPFFVYISRLEHPAKNHLSLIEAFARFKEKDRDGFKLVCVGGEWNGSDLIKETASRLCSPEDVLFTGFVDGDDVPHFLRAATAMVYPSFYEGFGLPVIEAMACGVPVACSRSSSLTEIAEGKALLFDPHSIEEIHHTLNRMAAEPELRQDLRRKGLVHAAGFTWERSVRETVSVWKSI